MSKHRSEKIGDAVLDIGIDQAKLETALRDAEARVRVSVDRMQEMLDELGRTVDKQVATVDFDAAISERLRQYHEEVILPAFRQRDKLLDDMIRGVVRSLRA